MGLVDQVAPEGQVLSTALSEMARWLAIPGEGWAGVGEQLWVPVGRQGPSPLSLRLLIRPGVLKPYTDEPIIVAD